MSAKPLFFQKLTIREDEDLNRVQDNIKRMVGELNEIVQELEEEIAAAAASGGGGGGGAETTGTAILDFTSTPGTDATVAVVGQAGILATSQVQCWFQEDSTALNDVQAHIQAAQGMGVGARSIVAGTGFTIDASTDEGFVEGTLKVRWAWQ